jgi:hypothetical protein
VRLFAEEEENINKRKMRFELQTGAVTVTSLTPENLK